MFCCLNCFLDEEIRAILSTLPKGKCDFCGCEDVPVCNLDENEDLAQIFEELLDIYTLKSDLPEDYPLEQTDLLKNYLSNKWQIFSKNLKSEDIYRLIKAICKRRFTEQPDLFNGPIGIQEINDIGFMNQHCILKKHSWRDFVEGIIKKNRFHNDYINTDVLASFLRFAVKECKPGEIYYRSRICENDKKLQVTEMGAPPFRLAKAGRINPEGIPVLYLSDSADTSLYEVRARLYDYVTVGKFVLKRPIKIVDFAGLNQISPFLVSQQGISFVEYAVNFEPLKVIANEIARPVRNSNTLEYLPTQYICDFVRSLNYDGIRYSSTVHQNGINLAVFDPSVFDCESTDLFDITKIDYQYQKAR